MLPAQKQPDSSSKHSRWATWTLPTAALVGSSMPAVARPAHRQTHTSTLQKRLLQQPLLVTIPQHICMHVLKGYTTSCTDPMPALRGSIHQAV
jgi:hypothetical protein